MFSTLPIEVIEKVTANLSNNDKIQCLTTCSAWYTHLYRVILRKVCINYRRDFIYFLQLLQTSDNSIGKHVKELYLKSGVGMTCEEFSLIVKVCPLLEVFKFSNWRYYKRNSLSSLLYLKQIPRLQELSKGTNALADTNKSLTHLDVYAQPVEELLREDRLLSFLKVGINLTHLTLEGVFRVDYPRARNIGTKLLEFNYQSWQALHDTCPHLVSINMNTAIFTATPREAEIMFNGAEMKQNHKLKELKLVHLCIEHPAWLSYIARMYPNLELLYMDYFLGMFVDIRDQTNAKLDSAACQIEFLRMAVHFDNLRSLTFKDLRESHFPGGMFFKVLNNSKLEYASIAYESGFCFFPGFNLQMLQGLVNGRENTLQSIKIGLWDGSHVNLNELLTPLSLCERLRRLSLTSEDFESCLYNPIPIDMILDECTQLTHLTFFRVVVTIEDKHSVKRKHPLTKLSLGVSKVSQEVFEYLSARCPNLIKMKVDNCIWMPREVEMKINMPHTKFEYLKISSITELFFPRLEGNLDELGDGRSVNLFCVTQLDKIEKQKQRYLNRREDINNTREIPDIAEDMSSWYHTYLITPFDRSYEPPTSIRKLRKQDVMLLKKIAQLVKENYHLVRMTRPEGVYRHEILSKREWIHDVQHGYVNVTCKSVHKLEYGKKKFLITWTTF